MSAARILWAEDSREDQSLIRCALDDLRAAPGSVQFVTDGAEVLDRLLEAQPDFLVLDIKMPRLGGIETLRRLRTGPANALRAAIFSSSHDPREVRAALALGAIEVLQKPLDYPGIKDAVERILALAAAGRKTPTPVAEPAPGASSGVGTGGAALPPAP